LTVSVASLLVPLALALIFTVFVLLTLKVLTVNVLLVWPVVIVTLLRAGLATLVLLLDKLTTVLLVAAALSVTVPVTSLPPLIVLGFKLTDFTPTTTVVLSLSELLDKSGSGSLAVTVAVLVILPVAVVFAVMVRVTFWPFARLGMMQVTVWPEIPQPGAEMLVKLAGSVSVMVTFVALPGPSFSTSIV
jgi:hypothetical protein